MCVRLTVSGVTASGGGATSDPRCRGIVRVQTRSLAGSVCRTRYHSHFSGHPRYMTRTMEAPRLFSGAPNIADFILHDNSVHEHCLRAQTLSSRMADYFRATAACPRSFRRSGPLNKSEFVTTAIELPLMIAPATAGESIIPQPGRNAPAASGMATMLYPRAHSRFERTCVWETGGWGVRQGVGGGKTLCSCAILAKMVK